MKTIFQMKTPKLLTVISFLIITALFFSCKKNTQSQPDPVVSSPQAQEFIRFTLDGVDTLYAVPADNMIYHGGDSSENNIMFNLGVVAIHHNGADSNFITFNFSKLNIAVGSSQRVGMMIQTGFNPLYPATPSQYVNITEYGNVGDFLAGNYSGPMIDRYGATRAVNVEFRIRITH
ncbi:MAG: hypothetical protein QM737_04630 [Ferruginibacter sp.]